MRRGIVLFGKIRIVHNGNKLVVVLPDIVSSSTQHSAKIQSHFWRGFWSALFGNQETANFHFAISTTYYQDAVDRNWLSV